VTRYVCVDDQKAAGFPVTAACEAAEVSTSGYYDWSAREAAGPTERQVAEAELVALMREIFDAADGNYGVPRMHTELRRAGLVVNGKKVHRLMRPGMAGRFRRRTCRTTFPGPDGYQIPDLIGRAFAPGAPDVVWCQDFTYVPTGEGWLFLASVLDLGSRRLLGYSMADHMRTELVLDALGMAVAARGGDHAVAGVIAHADRGSQYTSNDYLDFCQARQMRPSVGKTGICCDNAVAESFWESLKHECLRGRVFATRAEARRAIFRWINWYNTARLHTTLNGSPRSSGNSNTVKRHNHPSARRGDAQDTDRRASLPRCPGRCQWGRPRRTRTRPLRLTRAETGPLGSLRRGGFVTARLSERRAGGESGAVAFWMTASWRPSTPPGGVVDDRLPAFASDRRCPRPAC